MAAKSGKYGDGREFKKGFYVFFHRPVTWCIVVVNERFPFSNGPIRHY